MRASVAALVLSLAGCGGGNPVDSTASTLTKAFTPPVNCEGWWTLDASVDDRAAGYVTEAARRWDEWTGTLDMSLDADHVDISDATTCAFFVHPVSSGVDSDVESRPTHQTVWFGAAWSTAWPTAEAKVAAILRAIMVIHRMPATHTGGILDGGLAFSKAERDQCVAAGVCAR